MGFKVTETLSLGFSFGFAELAIYSQLDRYDTDPGATDPQPSEFEYVNDDDSSEQYTLAFLWNPFGELNIGAVYRYGPEFDTDKERWEQYDVGGGGDFEFVLDWKLRNKIKIPDVYGLGFSYRFLPNLTAALDVNYVEYSDLLEGFTMEPGAINDPNDIEIDDTFEFHVGIEYVMSLADVPFAIRGGYFYRPDSSARYVGPITSPHDQALKDRLASKDYDEHIFSAGFGTVLFDTLQVDVAGSFSKLISEGTLSVVYRY